MTKVTEYITGKPLSFQYMMYPRFLLETDLNETARLMYVLLMDRARLSQINRWIDKEGRVYIIFTISELVRISGKSRTTVKDALNKLEEAGLITREPQELGRPSHIYVKVPFIPEEPGQKTDRLLGRILTDPCRNTDH